MRLSRVDAVTGSFCLRVSSGFACSRFAPSALALQFQATKVAVTYRVSSLYSVKLLFHFMSEGGESQGENVMIVFASRFRVEKRRACVEIGKLGHIRISYKISPARVVYGVDLV